MRIDSGESSQRNFKKNDNKVNNTITYNATKNITISTPQVTTEKSRGSDKKETRVQGRKWYDTNAHCDYHVRIVGHSIENSDTFKKFVQNMINIRALGFDEPDVATNPLPNHASRGVNATEKEGTRRVKEVLEIKSTLSWVFKKLCITCLIKQNM
ncbi:hypothetical protein GQ457_16G021930 [Hibiscus cannabinus]